MRPARNMLCAVCAALLLMPAVWAEEQSLAGEASRAGDTFSDPLSSGGQGPEMVVVRAGSAAKYSWGNSIDNNRANCYGCGRQWDYEGTAPVESFEPNAFGLHDVHGNVYEWVEDCWNGSYEGVPADGSAWLGGDCWQRIFRGGSWDDFPDDLRMARRVSAAAGERGGYYGLRVARTLGP